MNAPLSPAELILAERMGPVREPWEHYVRTLLMAQESAREVMVLMAKREPERDWERSSLLRERLVAIEAYARRARLLWNAADLIVEELDLQDEGAREGLKFELELMNYYPQQETQKNDL